MFKRIMQKSALMAFVWSLSMAANAVADGVKQVNVPPGDLVQALQSLQKQADIDIVYQAAQLAGIKTRGVSGKLTPQEAVTKLLQGTKLHIRLDSASGAMLIEASSAQSSSTSTGGVFPLSEADGATGNGARNANSNSAEAIGDEHISGNPLRLAQVGQGSTSTGESEQSAQQASPPLSEIIVTAEKREERLADTPVPVTALDAQGLVDHNLLRLQDYYTSIPGISFAPDGERGGGGGLIIRGLGAIGGNPTVGIVVDDVPYGSSSFNGGGGFIPDIDPGDLAQVEVLRGPQGTLYGAESLGGLIHYVTVDPSTGALSGNLQAGTSSVYNGAKLGYDVRGAVNVPLGETLALRASGFSREDPGYIDDPGEYRDGVNREDVQGGRLAALWKPSDSFSLKLGALLQDKRSYGTSGVDALPGLGNLQQAALPGTGGYESKIQVYSANIAAKLGSMDLAAISGYTISDVHDVLDLTPLLSGVNTGFFVPPLPPGAPSFEHNKTDKFTQEVRLSASVASKVDWLLGAFYTNERTSYVQNIWAAELTGVPVLSAEYNTFPSTFKEYAAFADITVHFTEKFDVQFGGRESQNKQTETQTIIGPYVPVLDGVPSPYIVPKVDTKDSSFTYLVTPRFKISPDLMAYARLASGYRPGGPNTNAPGSGIPPSFAPDKTNNYEIGFKGDVLNHVISFDASLYYIKWKDVQLYLIDPVHFTGYTGNGGAAKSQGFEFSLESRPVSNMRIAGWLALNDAVLTQDLPPTSSVYGLSGDRLPHASRISGNASVDQEFALPENWIGSVGVVESYIGNQVGAFVGTPTAPRPYYPGYSRTDLRGSVKRGTWALNLFATNVLDKRALIQTGADELLSYRSIYIQPRTIGLSLAKRF